MTKPEWSKVNVILLAVSFWFFWNFWLTLFFVSANHLFSETTSDFHVFWLASRAWLLGMNPYLTAPNTTPFLYPPTSLPFFGLFSSFDFTLAAELWTVTYVSVFVVAALAIALTVREPRRSLFVSIVVLLFFSSFPFIYAIELSQGIELIIASLTVLSLVVERSNHKFLSALLLSIATLLKGPAIFLLIYFVIYRRNLRYLANFSISSFVIAGATLLVVPFKLYWYYAVNIVSTLYAGFSFDNSQSIVRLLYLAGLNEPVLEAISAAGFCLLAVFAFFANADKYVSAFGKKTLCADGFFLLNGLLILLLSPRSWIYPYVWVILPLALFLSAILMEHVKLAYLGVVGVASFLLNSQPSGYTGWFLDAYFVSMLVPTITIGNMIMILSLVIIYLRPNLVFTRLNR